MEDSNLVFRLPSAGDGALKAEIIEWFVAVGQRMEQGQPLCTVETDKSMIDLAAPFSGWVVALGGTAGEMLEVGGMLVTASTDGPAPEDVGPTPPDASDDGIPRPAHGAPGQPTRDPAPAGHPGTEPPGTEPVARVQTAGQDDDTMVSPLVRRLADEFGVDLDGLAGTGPDGRITRADVQRAAFGTVVGETDPAATPPTTANTTITTPTDSGSGAGAANDHPTLPIGRPADPDRSPAPPSPDPPPTTANLMISSPAAPTPSVTDQAGRAPGPLVLTEAGPNRSLTLYREVEVEQLLRAHERLNATIDGGLPLEALLMRLALPVLVEHPRMNARIDDPHQLVPADHYDMAFTCVSATALAVPVVRQVNDRSLRALGRAVGELSGRAVRGRLLPSETGRQTFTIHNLGPLGVTAGTTSLPAGTAALVSYGWPRPTLRLVAGSPREVPMMTVGVTVDHRHIDDGEAARFLAKIGLYLEEPILAFTD